MIKQLLAIIFYFFVLSLVGQATASIKLSSEVSATVRELEIGNIVSAEHTSVLGAKNRQYRSFEKLVEVATAEELVALMQHDNPSVRVYAFWGLMKKDHPELNLLIQSFYEDEAEVEFHEGCRISNHQVVELVHILWKTK